MKHTLFRIAAFMLCAVLGMGAPTATSQTQNPNIRITSPASAAPARGTINILGTANPGGFARYQLTYASEIAEAETPNWIPVGQSNQPVVNGQLGVWNTRALPNGGYSLRLQVFTSDNTILGEATVRNITLTNPVANTVVTTGTVSSTQTNGAAATSTRVGGFSLSDIPKGFTRGVTLVVYAFLAFGAYMLVKTIARYAIQKTRQNKPIDYGK